MKCPQEALRDSMVNTSKEVSDCLPRGSTVCVAKVQCVQLVADECAAYYLAKVTKDQSCCLNPG